jgi:hypothetical protein
LEPQPEPPKIQPDEFNWTYCAIITLWNDMQRIVPVLIILSGEKSNFDVVTSILELFVCQLCEIGEPAHGEVNNRSFE